jgi:hypothetical protein
LPSNQHNHFFATNSAPLEPYSATLNLEPSGTFFWNVWSIIYHTN